MGEEKLLPQDSGLRLQVSGASRDKGRGSSVHLAGAVRGVTLAILCGHTDGGNIFAGSGGKVPSWGGNRSQVRECLQLSNERKAIARYRGNSPGTP